MSEIPFKFEDLSLRYECFNCGAKFAEPISVTQTENLDGENGWWTHTDEYCPYCGSEWIEMLPEEGDDEDE